MSETVTENATRTVDGGYWIRSVALHSAATALSFMLFEVITALVLFSAGLRLGRRGLAAVAMLAGAILTLLGLSLVAGDTPGLAIPVAWAGRMVMTIALPVAVAVWMIRRSFAIGPVLVGMVVAAGAGHLGLEAVSRIVFAFSPWLWGIEQIESTVGPAMELQRTLGAPQDRIDLLQTVWDGLIRSFVPALYGSVAIVTFALGLIALPRMGLVGAGGGSFLLRNLRLPDSLLFAVIAGCLSPVYPEPLRTIGLNLIIVVGLLYLLQGLAVVRSLILRMELGTAGKVLVYGGLALLMLNGIVPMVLALVGLFDSFFDFRTPKNREKDNESNTD